MLSENEVKILEELKKRRTATAEELSTSLNMALSTVMSVSALLKEKGYVEVSEKEEEIVELTEEGKERAEKGLPEEVLISLLNGNPSTIQELKEKMGKDLDIAISWAKRKGLIRIEGNRVIPLVSSYTSPERKALENPASASPDVVKLLQSRGLIKVRKKKTAVLTLIKEPELKRANIINVLTSEIISKGTWRSAEIRPYNVEAYPAFYPIGKKHFFREFLERIRQVMLDLGFNEVRGDYVEMELYNFDLLFQPQDHPAREIHDSFPLRGKGSVKDERLLEGVRRMHESGWKYTWNQETALRLMLRSQTTAVTARVLASRPKPPVRAFTIGKVFRPDAIDATHLIEFHQLDGVVIEDGYSFRDLLGELKEIFYRMGVKEVKFKPAYFPFTEPSVEVYGRIEGLGWVEMSGAGMLRDEILRTVGIEQPAGAWGIGLDRLAMFFNGLNDIRLLYSNNIEFLRERKVIRSADNSGQ